MLMSREEKLIHLLMTKKVNELLNGIGYELAS